MKYIITNDKDILLQADRLLYEELWKPLGFPADVREQFKAGPAEIIIVALQANTVFGAFVLVDNGDGPVEIRHAAISADYRKQAVGSKLFKRVLKYVRALPDMRGISVYARNTSLAFWQKLGFVECSDWLEHDSFVPHGIRFKKMIYQFAKINACAGDDC